MKQTQSTDRIFCQDIILANYIEKKNVKTEGPIYLDEIASTNENLTIHPNFNFTRNVGKNDKQ